jgi:AhpD family alkylhydroperoxidase
MSVAPKPLNQYPAYLQPLFWLQRRKYGAVLQSGLLWARVPRIFSALALLYGAIDRRSSPIPPQLRSLITVRVSQINWCSFCVDLNSASLLERGASQEKLEALGNWQESRLFDEKERAALEYAEVVTRSDLRVNQELMTRVKRYFDGDDLVELTALISFQNMSSKFNSALGVEPQGFCLKPDAVKVRK